MATLTIDSLRGDLLSHDSEAIIRFDSIRVPTFLNEFDVHVTAFQKPSGLRLLSGDCHSRADNELCPL